MNTSPMIDFSGLAAPSKESPARLRTKPDISSVSGHPSTVDTLTSPPIRANEPAVLLCLGDLPIFGRLLDRGLDAVVELPQVDDLCVELYLTAMLR